MLLDLEVNHGSWGVCDQRLNLAKLGRPKEERPRFRTGPEKLGCQFIVVAQKTPRLLEELNAAHWKRSPRTDADEQGEFWYQPAGWERAHRFIALRYKKEREAKEESEQYQLFETWEYLYRVFVTSMDSTIYLLVSIVSELVRRT